MKKCIYTTLVAILMSSTIPCYSASASQPVDIGTIKKELSTQKPQETQTQSSDNKGGSGGYFNGCTKNPFGFCSGPRPGRKDPMRGCYDAVCPRGR